MKSFKYIGLYISFTIIMIFSSGCSQKNCYGKNCTISANHPTMKPYRVHGIRYRPTFVRVGDTMRGVASWYGPGFHRKQTSNCETYNMYAMTAAHKTWPMNTMVKATCRDTGKSVIVRINDRGPFVSGRVIDLSYKAGKMLGLDKKGITRIKLEVLGFKGKVKKSTKRRFVTKTEKVKYVDRVLLTNFAVQVGSFMDLNMAKKYKIRYALISKDYKISIKIAQVDNITYYRVWIDGFKSENEARYFIKKNALYGAIVTRGDSSENCKRD
ncbi:Rare lipoprotein A precursor [hydrothermal vent metagenome]|uniref:Rare lipoprotein A n=1 Tax=hydrothermal vent metagenome TaxID=652676 RepID=A0A1W1EJK9_9ZZZZ